MGNFHLIEYRGKRDTLRHFSSFISVGITEYVGNIRSVEGEGSVSRASGLKGSLFLKYLCVCRRKRKYCMVFDIVGLRWDIRLGNRGSRVRRR